MIRFRERPESFVPGPPEIFGHFRMENRGTGRPSGLPSVVTSQRMSTMPMKEWCFDQVNPGPPFRTGGPFFLTRKFFHANQKQGNVYLVGPRITDPEMLGFVPTPEESWHWTYKGGFGDPILGAPPPLPAMAFQPTGVESGFHPDANPDNLGSFGNRGWAKLRPDPAQGSLAQAVLELREAPKMLQTSARSFHLAWTSWRRTTMQSDAVNRELLRDHVRQVPDEFLNQQFGWFPFFRDLSEQLKLVTDFRNQEAKFLRLNGQWQKRRWREPDFRLDDLVYQSNSNSADTYASPSLFSFREPFNIRDPEGQHGHGRPDHLGIRRQVIVEIWYEGKFRSYRPEFDKGLESGYPALDSARRWMAMSGLQANPTTLYNIVPWTWLIDWFAGVGDAIQRYEDMLTDSVACEYFYLMRRIVDRLEYTITKQTCAGPLELKWFDGVETKRRAVGKSAFGFSGSPSGLTSRQQAILGALAVANRPR